MWNSKISLSVNQSADDVVNVQAHVAMSDARSPDELDRSKSQLFVSVIAWIAPDAATTITDRMPKWRAAGSRSRAVTLPSSKSTILQSFLSGLDMSFADDDHHVASITAAVGTEQDQSTGYLTAVASLEDRSGSLAKASIDAGVIASCDPNPGFVVHTTQLEGEQALKLPAGNNEGVPADPEYPGDVCRQRRSSFVVPEGRRLDDHGSAGRLRQYLSKRRCLDKRFGRQSGGQQEELCRPGRDRLLTQTFAREHAMPSDSGIPAIRTFQMDGNSIGNLRSSVNLFRGDVNYTQTLFSMPGRTDKDGLNVDVAIQYESNVRDVAMRWNRDQPTGILEWAGASLACSSPWMTADRPLPDRFVFPDPVGYSQPSCARTRELPVVLYGRRPGRHSGDRQSGVSGAARGVCKRGLPLSDSAIATAGAGWLLDDRAWQQQFTLVMKDGASCP